MHHHYHQANSTLPLPTGVKIPMLLHSNLNRSNKATPAMQVEDSLMAMVKKQI
jgi:hypothetical protein